MYGNFNQNTNSSISLTNQSQGKVPHKKSESIDFLTQNLQYGKQQSQYANGFSQKQQVRKTRDHNKSIGAMPDSSFGGLHTDSHGLLSGLETNAHKHSMDSADLMNRNNTRGKINTLEHDVSQDHRPSGLQQQVLAQSIQNLQKANNSIIIQG